MAVIAVVFDFDDTLAPDSTTQLLDAHGVDTDDLWSRRAPALVAEGYDPPLAYLRCLLDWVGPGRPLGELTNADLAAFGAELDASFFPGLPGLFGDLEAIAAAGRDVSVEFYIVSSGLQALIAGSGIVQRHLTGVYGCQLGENEAGHLAWVKRCVTFTEKTRFLFEINKGIGAAEAATQPHLVNRRVPVGERRVPFEHMVFVGDGVTDIPCFSLVGDNGGTAFGVFDPSDSASAKRTFREFLRAGRVVSSHAPRFGPDDELGALLRAAVGEMVTHIEVRRARP